MKPRGKPISVVDQIFLFSVNSLLFLEIIFALHNGITRLRCGFCLTHLVGAQPFFGRDIFDSANWRKLVLLPLSLALIMGYVTLMTQSPKCMTPSVPKTQLLKRYFFKISFLTLFFFDFHLISLHSFTFMRVLSRGKRSNLYRSPLLL